MKGRRNKYRLRMFVMQRGQCCWCKGQMQVREREKWNYATFEHLVPKVLGGTYALKNIMLAHKKCNHERGLQAKQTIINHKGEPRGQHP